MGFLDLLNRSRLVFAVFIAGGLLFPQFAFWLKPYIIVIGMILVTLSLLDIDLSSHHLTRWNDLGWLIGLNYGILSVIYFTTATFFPAPYNYGFAILALMPPAVAVLSLSNILDGDLDLSFYGECACYLLSLVIIPVALYLSFNEVIGIQSVLRSLGLVIIVPLVLSRGLRLVLADPEQVMDSYGKAVFNVTCGLSYMVVVGVNQYHLLNNDWLVLSIFATLIAIRLATSEAVHQVIKDRLRHSIDVDMVLFGSLKNSGLAAIFVLTLVGNTAALPLAVDAVVGPIHIVFLEERVLPSLQG